MNWRSFSVAALIASCLIQSSCSLTQQQGQTQNDSQVETEDPTQRPPLYLGSVHQVYPERHFALLRIIGPMPAEGAVLISHPFDGTTDRIGNLCVASGQHSRNGIIAADIRSGVVMKGDRVFQYRNILSDTEDTETTHTSDTSEAPVFEGLEQDVVLPQESFNEETPDYGVSRFNAAKAQQEPISAEPEPAFSAAPEPVELPDPEPDDTIIDPMISTPAIPGSSIQDIPDTIDGWDNM